MNEPDRDPPRSISISDAVGDAMQRTLDILFRPFDIGKWFTLGWCAFLAQLGESGGGGGGNFSRMANTWNSGSTGDPSAKEWIEQNLQAIIAVGAAVFIGLVGLWLVLRWLGARGTFMFIDGIVRNRGAVREPWNNYRAVANNYFLFSIMLDLLYLLSAAGCVAIGVAVAWPDIEAERMGDAGLAGLILGVCLLAMVVVVYVLAKALLIDFVVPAMYVYGERVLDAWARVRTEMIRGHVGSIVLFYLMKIVLWIGVIVVVIASVFLTCCLVVVPYLGTVILLPLFVFMRSYALCFVEQFGWPLSASDVTSGVFE